MPKISKIHAVVLCGLAASFGFSGAYAERADRSKPLNFEADAGRIDDVRRTGVLTGNVVITKGTLLIRAGRVEIKEDTDGFQKALAFFDGKKLAYFKQKREGVDEVVEAESELMDYDERADTITFTRSAIFRTYRASVLANEVAGAVIVYDSKAETFSVDGDPSKTGAIPGARFRGIIMPKSTASSAPESPARLRLSVDGKSQVVR